jgi:hypothetical protein
MNTGKILATLLVLAVLVFQCSLVDDLAATASATSHCIFLLNNEGKIITKPELDKIDRNHQTSNNFSLLLTPKRL